MRCSSVENPRGERFGGVVIEHRNSGLADDRAGVEAFVDKVHGAAGEFDAVLDGLVLGVEAGESGQQRRMDIQNAQRKCLR